MSDVTPPGGGAPAGDGPAAAAGGEGSGARRPGAVRRAIGRLPASLKTGAAVLTAIASMVGSVLLLGQEVPQLPHAIDSIRTSFEAPVKPNPLVVFVSSDDVLTNSYLDLLEGDGVPVQTLDPSQVRDLLGLRPGLVIFGASSPRAEPPILDPDVRRFLAGEAKVIGIGLLGTRTFEAIEPNSALSTRHAAGMTSHVLRLARRLSAGLRGTLPPDASFSLYDQQTDDPSVAEEAILNLGGLERQGARAIAELDEVADACVANPWPVAQQGNRVFWGSGQPAWRLSSEAQQLFVNIVHDLLATDLQRQGPQTEFPPDSYPGRTLACRNTQNEYPLQLSGPGVIDVGVQSKSHLVLTLAAPRPEDDRTVKGESLRLRQQVTADQLRQTDSWLVLVTYDGSLTQSSAYVEYDLVLDYPSRSVSPFQVRAILAGLVVGALLAALAAWLLWARRADLRARLDAPSRRLRLLLAALRGA